MSKKVRKCCLCSKILRQGEYGNNPEPLADSGICCDDCNRIKVIPARLAGMRQHTIQLQKEIEK